MSESRILYTPRQEKRKQKKFSKKKLRIVLASLGFFVFFVLCVSLVRLSYFQIREIRLNEAPTFVGGAGMEQDTQGLQTAINDLLSGSYAMVIPKRFIFGVSGRKMEQQLLAALPRFAAISVTKQFPHALSVSYAKRIFFALLCNDAAKTDTHSCGYIDRTGFVYEDAPEASGSLIVKVKSDLPSVKVGTHAIDEQTLNQMALFGDGVGRIAGLRLIAYELAIRSPDELRMHVADGFMLIVKKNDDPESILRILRIVLDEEIKADKSKLDYIDLRLGNKVFYKYK